jgi:hypothetical protein
MFDSAIIEVIIGMIFVFSLLSILVTQVNTLITNLLNTRAKHLKHGLSQMITDPVILAKFMSHPLIGIVPPETRAMPEQTISAQTAEAVSAKEPTKVNWIPATLFSQALLDIVSAETANNLYKPLYDAVARSLTGSDEARAREMVRRLQGSSVTLDELRAYFETLPAPARQTLTITLDRTQKAQTALSADDANSKLIPLLEGIRHIQEPVFQKALDTLLATARSVEEASAKLEFWFNTRMDQLSEVYRRNIQYLSLFIGLMLALLLNADSLHIARTLWEDPAVRVAISAAAQAAVQSGQLSSEIQQSQAQQNAIQGTPVPGADPAANPDVSQPSNTDLADEVRLTINQLLGLRLPLGWELTPVEGCQTPEADTDLCSNPRNFWSFVPANNPDWFGLILRKLAGYIITIIAVAQGAPFWFDLLNRLARGNSGS